MRNWFNLGSDTHNTNTDRHSHTESDKEWFEAFISKLLDSNRKIDRLPNQPSIAKGGDHYFSHLTISNEFRVVLRYSPKGDELILSFPDDWYQESTYSTNKPVGDIVQEVYDELTLASGLLATRLQTLAKLIKSSLSNTGYADIGKKRHYGLTGFYTPTGKGNHQHGITLSLTSSIYGDYELAVAGSGHRITTSASRYKVGLDEVSQEFVKFIEDQAQADNTAPHDTRSNKGKGVLDINIPENIHTVKITQAGSQEVTVTLGDTTEDTQTTGLSLDVIASELEDTLAYGTKYRGLGVKVEYVNTKSGDISGIVFMKNRTEHKFVEQAIRRPFNLVWDSARKRAFLSVSGDVVEGAFEHEDELNEKTVADWVKRMISSYTFFGSFLSDH